MIPLQRLKFLKKATGLEFWVKEAVIVCPKHLFQPQKGEKNSWLSNDLTISFFRYLMVSVYFLVRGKLVILISGCNFLEKFDIHLE